MIFVLFKQKVSDTTSVHMPIIKKILYNTDTMVFDQPITQMENRAWVDKKFGII